MAKNGSVLKTFLTAEPSSSTITGWCLWTTLASSPRCGSESRRWFTAWWTGGIIIKSSKIFLIQNFQVTDEHTKHGYVQGSNETISGHGRHMRGSSKVSFAALDRCFPKGFVARSGEYLGIAPGGAYESLFGDSSYPVLWQSRVGFAKVAIKANKPIIPVFTENIRENTLTLAGRMKTGKSMII